MQTRPPQKVLDFLSLINYSSSPPINTITSLSALSLASSSLKAITLLVFQFSVISFQEPPPSPYAHTKWLQHCAMINDRVYMKENIYVRIYMVVELTFANSNMSRRIMTRVINLAPSCIMKFFIRFAQAIDFFPLVPFIFLAGWLLSTAFNFRLRLTASGGGQHQLCIRIYRSSKFLNSGYANTYVKNVHVRFLHGAHTYILCTHKILNRCQPVLISIPNTRRCHDSEMAVSAAVSSIFFGQSLAHGSDDHKNWRANIFFDKLFTELLRTTETPSSCFRSHKISPSTEVSHMIRIRSFRFFVDR